MLRVSVDTRYGSISFWAPTPSAWRTSSHFIYSDGTRDGEYTSATVPRFNPTCLHILGNLFHHCNPRTRFYQHKHDTPDRLVGGKVMNRSRLAAAFQNRAGETL